MATMTVGVALEAGDLLGEGPVWCAEEQSLYWVDIKKPSVRRWKPDTGEQRVWPVPAEIGSMALRSLGG
ncbi:MAG TPA: SMP-30/gluconolactonase/LRE family protein, partial [Nocardioidaceae bacterium]|nr:SMP-30/gluconolactonase/LRE family protein [Nocardioidaceae bacterium]